MIIRSTCFLCGRPLKPIEESLGFQWHEPAEDCLVGCTDKYGISVEPEAVEWDVEPSALAPIDDPDIISVDKFPAVDQVLVKAFGELKLPRLGGQSTGRGWSNVSLFQKCPYAWKLRYIEKLPDNPILATLVTEKPALAIGTLIHTFLALHYSNMVRGFEHYGVTSEWMRDRLLREANPELVNEGWRCFVGYRLFYQGENIIPLAIEYDLRDPRTNESSRPDLIALFPEERMMRPAGTYMLEHKCLRSHEKLFDYGTGQFLTVEAMARKQLAPVVLAYDETSGRFVKTQAKVPQPVGVRPIHTVTLDAGQTIGVSANHPILTAEGWVFAENLQPGMWVALPSTTAGYDGPSQFTDAEVEFVGLMIGDGTISSGTFTKGHLPVMERFLHVAMQLGSPGQVRATTAGRPTPYAQVSMAAESPARLLLERVGLSGALAATKHVCDQLMAIPDRQVDLLLAALWNTDGCVDVFDEARDGKTQKKVRAAYVSRSKALCGQVAMLLRRRGITSTVVKSTVEYNGERRPYWRVAVATRSSKRRFLEMIMAGQIPFVKYDVAAAYVAIKDGDDSPIPTAYIKRSVPDKAISGVLRSQLKTTTTISRSALEKHFVTRGSPELRAVLFSPLEWAQVDSLVVSEPCEMYNLEVPGVHTFVVGDIVTHNSAGRFDKPTLEGWHNDGEVLGQILGWKELRLEKRFGELQGVMVNIIGKQTKEQLFHRVIVPADSWPVEQHKRELKEWEGLIQLSIGLRKFPRARNSCVSRYGMCEHFHHCATGE